MLRLLILAVLACIAAPAAVDLLVQGAVDGELQPLLRALHNRHEVTVASWTFWTGRIGNKTVVISRTDVGPINAVAATTIGIQRFQPRGIINQGTAGGHSRKVKLWDIILGERTTDYSAFTTAHADDGAGINPLKWRPKPHVIRVDGVPVRFERFPGDPVMLAHARGVPYSRGRVLTGNIGSAFQYNRELDFITAMNRVFQTDSEDMESAYAAGVADAFKTPFLAIRIISDTEWEHPTFERIAGQYCAEFVLNLIRRLE